MPPKRQRSEQGSSSGSTENNTVLMYGLPLHVSYRTLFARFNTYDEIQQITFVDRGCVTSYTRSCLIKLKSQTTVTEFLERQELFSQMNRVTVNVVPFQGWEHHQEVYNRGIYKLVVTGVDIKNDVTMYKFMEQRFHEFSYTEIAIVKREGNPTGVVKFRFTTESGRSNAKLKMDREFKRWTSTVKASKQELRIKRSRTNKGITYHSSSSTSTRKPEYPVKEWTPVVGNQKTEPYCLYFALTDMMTTTLRMQQKRKDLNLTIQGLVERQKSERSQLVAYCTNAKLYGFETTAVSPYEKLRKCPPNGWSVSEYQVPSSLRYTIDDIDVFTRKADIKSSILAKFEDGVGAPCVAEMRKGQLGDRTSKDRRPYHHTPGTEHLGAKHAVLIVGINIKDDDEANHYCHVKNSWGENWGDKGFTNIGFDVILAVWIPRHH